ncbi:hypothetical protein [Paenibacillus sp. MER 99-2]|uniref:hypothetical protein n=1 Tax=Paenibacillus sp. MER 99-2 TaxID=2939572 RepID=UPI00203CEB26|nr:hypothetical protein [Paenibacillus sp. MER 99-2]MCM3174938.1 hypothetical protein [Paenibacillus sp. MER 99-2]
MHKRNRTTSYIWMMLVCSVLLVSCDAITSQQIAMPSSNPGMTGFPNMNGGDGGMNGAPNANGGFNRGGAGGTDSDARTGNREAMRGGMMNADSMGKVISVDGNVITVALLEPVQNGQPSSSSDNSQQGSFPGTNMEMNATGVEMKWTVNDDVTITRGMAMGIQDNNSNASSALQLSDLKQGDMIMIWYQDNTEKIERIVINAF